MIPEVKALHEFYSENRLSEPVKNSIAAYKAAVKGYAESPNGLMMDEIQQKFQRERDHIAKMTATGWHVVEIDSIVKCSDAMKGGHSNRDWKERLSNARDWCNNNCTGRHTSLNNYYWFKYESDALLFKLAKG